MIEKADSSRTGFINNRATPAELAAAIRATGLMPRAAAVEERARRRAGLPVSPGVALLARYHEDGSQARAVRGGGRTRFDPDRSLIVLGARLAAALR